MLAYFDGNEFANELAESIKGYGHEPCLRTKKETKENKTLSGTQCVSNYEVVAYWLRAKPSSNRHSVSLHQIVFVLPMCSMHTSTYLGKRQLFVVYNRRRRK